MSLNPTRVTLARYSYDSGADCLRPKGRLCSVKDASDSSGLASYHGEESFSYDFHGNLTNRNKSITVTSGSWTSTKSFQFVLGYDIADRLQSITYPRDLSSETLTYSYDRGGHVISAQTPSQTFLTSADYDRFGRRTDSVLGYPGVSDKRIYYDGPTEGAANRFRLKSIQVSAGGMMFQKFDYPTYDRAGNLLQVSDDISAPGYTYSSESNRDNSWAHQFDGIGRLQHSEAAAADTWGPSSFAYDPLGNLTNRGALSLTPHASQPHHVAYATPPGSAAADLFTYDANGSLSYRPDTDAAGPETARTLTYDAEGRLRRVVSGSTATESLYDYTGSRVARVVGSGPTATVSLYFDRYFEITGNKLTRHIYMGDTRIAQSDVTLPPSSPWYLAARDSGSMFATAQRALDLLATSTRAVGEVVAVARAGVPLAYLALIALLALSGLAQSAKSADGARRQYAWLLLCVYSVGLCALSPGHRAEAGGPSGNPQPPPPVLPTYYVHTDHLGSTTLLTCDHRVATENCPDRTPATFFRYDSYGATKAFQKNGTPIAAGAELTDLLYTGQRWDAPSRLYYYQARFYDPRIAQFLSTDPAREYPNPYAYVKWNPVRFTDPSGMTISERLFDGGTVNTFGWVNSTTGMVVPASQVAEAAAQQAQPTQVATAAILPWLARVYGLPLVALTGKVLGDVATDWYKHRSESVEDQSPSPTKNENTNPYEGPVDVPVVVVDEYGNAIPVGER